MARTNRILHRSYAEDYCGWVEDTARAIEDGRFSEIEVLAGGA